MRVAEGSDCTVAVYAMQASDVTRIDTWVPVARGGKAVIRYWAAMHSVGTRASTDLREMRGVGKDGGKDLMPTHGEERAMYMWRKQLLESAMRILVDNVGDFLESEAL